MSVGWVSRERSEAEVTTARAAWRQYQALPEAAREGFLADLVEHRQAAVLAAISVFLRNEGFARFNRPCPAELTPEDWKAEASDFLRRSDAVARLAEAAAA